MNKILFVCVENSCRSQMAEGFAKAHGKEKVEPASAGSAPSGKVNETAIRLMKEKNIDLTSHSSKGLDQVGTDGWDAVITMGCGDACPNVKASQIREDWPLPDPKNKPDPEFRQIRDDIEQRVKKLIDSLVSKNA